MSAAAGGDWMVVAGPPEAMRGFLRDRLNERLFELMALPAYPGNMGEWLAERLTEDLTVLAAKVREVQERRLADGCQG